MIHICWHALTTLCYMRETCPMLEAVQTKETPQQAMDQRMHGSSAVHTRVIRTLQIVFLARRAPLLFLVHQLNEEPPSPPLLSLSGPEGARVARLPWVRVRACVAGVYLVVGDGGWML